MRRRISGPTHTEAFLSIGLILVSDEVELWILVDRVGVHLSMTKVDYYVLLAAEPRAGDTDQSLCGSLLFLEILDCRWLCASELYTQDFMLASEQVD